MEAERPTNRKGPVVFSLLFLLVLVLRLPFFFPAVIDWDESTYVIMGQSILDGHLPYMEQWEDKPPLTYVFYAFAITAFGKDLVGIRFAGTLCVALTAYFVYLTGRHLWGRRTGIMAAMLCAVAISVLGSGQATMTEHIALVPLMGGLSLLVSRETSSRTTLLAGILMAVSTLVRLNLAYVTVLVGFYVLLAPPVRSAGNAVRRGLSYAGAGILVVTLVWVPYLLAGRPEIPWTLMIMPSLRYSGSESSILDNLISQVEHVFGMYKSYGAEPVFRELWVGLLLWLEAGAGLALSLARWRTAGGITRRGSALVMLFLIGTAFSILKSGNVWEHHMIQLVPFSALLAALFYEKVLFSRQRWAFLLPVAIIFTIAVGPILSEYRVMISRALAGKELRYGPAYEIAAYLKQENKSGRPVFLFTQHIVYWFIGQYPLTRWVHPSTITRPYALETLVGKGASTEEELRKVLRKKPEFIVTEDNLGYLREFKSAQRLLEETLADEFIFVGQTEGQRVYRRKASIGNSRV